MEVTHLPTGTILTFPCHAFIDRKCGFARTLHPADGGWGGVGAAWAVPARAAGPLGSGASAQLAFDGV